jgi:hypothetical protein
MLCACVGRNLTSVKGSTSQTKTLFGAELHTDHGFLYRLNDMHVYCNIYESSLLH